MSLQYRKSKRVNLKNHPALNEKWLQGLIAEDPTLLSLGDLTVKDVERRQPRAGRLDLLLTDPETHTRYEVEVQLGATDEAHIIRTIEYWDIEKARYPQYEHVAVIVAEDITSRFLNVINLFNRAIPLVAIEIRALEVEGVITLNATTVLDLVRLGTDEEDEPGQATDRAYWVQRGSQSTVGVAEQMLALINETTGAGVALKWNKHYVGLAKDGVATNFCAFRPRKETCVVEFRVDRSDTVTALIDDSGMDNVGYDTKWSRYRVRLTGPEVSQHRDLLIDLIRRAHGSPAPIDE